MAALLFLLLFFSLKVVYAAGEGNMDGGGGGMGSGTSQNKWVPGEDGVRVTIVNAADEMPASASIDLSNVNPRNIVLHLISPANHPIEVVLLWCAKPETILVLVRHRDCQQSSVQRQVGLTFIK